MQRHHGPGGDHGLLATAASTSSSRARRPRCCSSRPPASRSRRRRAAKCIPAEEKTKDSGKYKGFKVTAAQVREIAKKKLQDLNARDLDHAVRIIAGTARSMGLTVEG